VVTLISGKKGTSGKLRVLWQSGKWHGHVIKNKIEVPLSRKKGFNSNVIKNKIKELGFPEKKETSGKSWVLQHSGKWKGDVRKNKIKELPERAIGCATFQKKEN